MGFDAEFEQEIIRKESDGNSGYTLLGWPCYGNHHGMRKDALRKREPDDILIAGTGTRREYRHGL